MVDWKIVVLWYLVCCVRNVWMSRQQEECEKKKTIEVPGVDDVHLLRMLCTYEPSRQSTSNKEKAIRCAATMIRHFPKSTMTSVLAAASSPQRTVILLLVVIFCLSTTTITTTTAIPLTIDNFEAATKGRSVFIKFYAPWCGHCRAMAEDWQKLEEDWKEHDVALIAEVDCTSDAGQPLCDEFQVEVRA